MKKLFLVLGVFALLFGLSGFDKPKETQVDEIKSGATWYINYSNWCHPLGTSCVSLDTVIIK